MIASRSIGVLIVVSTLATVVAGLSCRTPFDTLGKCVELQECSKWNQILNQSYISKSEFKLLNDALAACADSAGTEFKDRKMCCSLEDIYTKDVEVLIPPKCVEGNETLDPERMLSSKTSFGVFIYINNQTQNLMRRCVGSLIDVSYVLTSAHCVHKVASESITVYINAKYVYNGENGTVAHGVKPSHVESVIIHNEYDPARIDFDVALLRLKERVNLNSPGSPYPICIPAAKEHYEPDNIILHSFGWGANAKGVFSDIKLSVTLQRITIERCVKEGTANVHTDGSEIIIDGTDLICTIGISGHNLFEGYSGAPLMYRKNGAWFLLGVVGKPLNPAEKSATYKPNRVLSTSLQNHRGWIEDTFFNDQQDMLR